MSSQQSEVQWQCWASPALHVRVGKRWHGDKAGGNQKTTQWGLRVWTQTRVAGFSPRSWSLSQADTAARSLWQASACRSKKANNYVFAHLVSFSLLLPSHGYSLTLRSYEIIFQVGDNAMVSDTRTSMPNPKSLDSAFILLHSQLCRCNLILTQWKGEVGNDVAC